MALSPEQRENRKRGAGCSELLAALGKDPRCTRLELYMRKVGDLPEPNLDDDERVHFGKVLEPVVRQEAAKRLGARVIVPKQTLFHPVAPLVGHPDGWFPRLRAGLECKAADKFEAEEFGEPDSDQVPVRYLVQCAGYMALTNAAEWHLAVLIGGNDFRMYRIPRDPQLEEAILAGVREFWTHVEQRRPPDPETPEDVKLRWPKDLGTTIAATPEIIERCGELAIAKRDLKVAEMKEAGIKADIERFMTDHGQLVDGSGKLLATWRKNRDSRVLDIDKLKAEQPEIYETYLRDRTGARPFLLK